MITAQEKINSEPGKALKAFINFGRSVSFLGGRVLWLSNDRLRDGSLAERGSLWSRNWKSFCPTHECSGTLYYQ